MKTQQRSSKIRKRKLGSYPLTSVFVSMVAALLVLGLFGWIILYSSRLSTNIQENIEVQVYLNNNLSASDISRLQSTIATQPYILVKENAEIIFITKDEAAIEFMNTTGEDFVNFLGDNPLRDLLAIKVKKEYQTLDSLKKIKADIQGMGGVFEVEYEENLVESITRNLAIISFVLTGLAIFAFLVVIIFINNTIKLALFSQRFLIRSMQLVGATRSFIQKPFLYRSVWYGFLSGGMACLILYFFTEYLNTLIEDIKKLQDIKGTIILFASILAIGMVIGYFSCLRAMRKYLKMSLDELY